MKPPRSILDPAFVYVPASKTDIRATFRRVRAEQQAAATGARKAEPIKLQRRKQQ